MSLAIPGWKPKFKTLEESLMYMSESMERSRAETERALKASREESERALKASHERTERAMRASREEADKRRAETEARMAASREETERALKESHERTERELRDLKEALKTLSEEVRRVDAGIGTMGNRFGTLVELVVIPGIRREINAYGHDFRRAFANKVIRSHRQDIAEVDLFLYDGTEALAAEVKAGLTEKDVKDHIQRLKTLRKYEVEAKLEGKKLYGALVGVYVEEKAKELALRNGLYVLEILEEEKKLKTAAPKHCRAW